MADTQQEGIIATYGTVRSIFWHYAIIAYGVSVHTYLLFSALLRF